MFVCSRIMHERKKKEKKILVLNIWLPVTGACYEKYTKNYRKEKERTSSATNLHIYISETTFYYD